MGFLNFFFISISLIFSLIIDPFDIGYNGIDLDTKLIHLNINSVIICALAGLFLGYFYTAPPLRLVARKGLGELTIFLTFGPLITIGTAFAIFNGDLNSTEHLINCLYIGIPMGLLTTNILLINEFPDMESDQKTHKNHLVVTLGKKAGRWGYLVLLIFAFLSSYLLSSFL